MNALRSLPSENCLVVSDSLRSHGLHSPWNSPGQNTGLGYPVSPSPWDIPNPGIESRSPTLQTDSLPAEPPGKPKNTGVGSLSLFTFMHWRRKWQPTPMFLPGESQGQGSLVGCRLWGHTESDMTEAT